MSRIHANLEYKDFSMPASVERKTVCSLTGCLARAGSCPAVTEFFAAGSVPDEVCPGHAGYDDGSGGDGGDTSNEGGGTGNEGGGNEGGGNEGGGTTPVDPDPPVVDPDPGVT